MQGVERMAAMSEEEKQRWREERRAKVDARKAAAEEKKAKLAEVCAGARGRGRIGGTGQMINCKHLAVY